MYTAEGRFFCTYLVTLAIHKLFAYALSMAQHKLKAHHSEKEEKGWSNWGLFFIFLVVIDSLFILQILHALYLYPIIQIGSMSVVIVALLGSFIILSLSLLHLTTLSIYLFVRRPRDWRLFVSISVLMVSIFFLYKYDLAGTVQGYIEKATIQNESVIAKKTALRFLQECRVNDLVLTKKYGAKLTYNGIGPEAASVKTVYIGENDIQDVYSAVKAKGDECGQEIKIYNDGTLSNIK